MSLDKSRENRNIERNNDVTVLVDTLDPLRGILIYGAAEIDHDNVYEQALTINETSPAFIDMPKEKLQRLTRAYVDTWKSLILKITPKHITTFDYTKDKMWSNFVKTYLQE